MLLREMNRNKLPAHSTSESLHDFKLGLTNFKFGIGPQRGTLTGGYTIIVCVCGPSES
jgi:hypothetical protein